MGCRTNTRHASLYQCVVCMYKNTTRAQASHLCCSGCIRSHMQERDSAAQCQVQANCACRTHLLWVVQLHGIPEADVLLLVRLTQPHTQLHMKASSKSTQASRQACTQAWCWVLTTIALVSADVWARPVLPPQTQTDMPAMPGLLLRL
jgi:hypothetical protein